MTYYLKAAALIASNPRAVWTHSNRGTILRGVLMRDFRLHWLRDVVRG